MFRGSVKSTGYQLQSPVSPLLPPPLRHRVPSHFNWSLHFFHIHPVTAVNISSAIFHSHRPTKAGNTDIIPLTPLSEADLAMHRYSQHSQRLNSISWRPATQNFTDICQEMCKLQTYINLRRQVLYGWTGPLTVFHGFPSSPSLPPSPNKCHNTITQ